MKKCCICGEIISEDDIRDHMMLHNPNFDEVPWDELPVEDVDDRQMVDD